MPTDSKRIGRRLLIHTSNVFASQIVAGICSMLLLGVMGRYFGVEGYGQATLAMAVVGFTQLLVDWRVGDAIVKFGAAYESDGRPGCTVALVWWAYGLTLVFGALNWVLAYAIAGVVGEGIYGSAEVAAYIRLYSFVLVLGLTWDVSQAVLKLFKDFRAFSIIKGAEGIITLAMVWAVVDHGLADVMWARTAMGVIFPIVYGARALWLMHRHSGHVRPESIRGEARRIAPFCWQTFLSGCLKALHLRMDVLLLGVFRGEAAVGVYSAGKAVASQLQVFYGPAHVVIYPTLAELAAKREWDLLRRLIRKAARWMLVLLCASAAGMILVVPRVVQVWKPEFSPSVRLMAILCIAYILNGSLFWTRPAALALHRPGLSTLNSLIRCVMLILLSCALVPAFGAQGQAWTVTASMAASAGTTAWLIARQLRREMDAA